MYGGTAQIMMMYYGVDSIAHGVHYQMSRSGITEGGGPAHFFYVPNLRQRIRTIEASTIIANQSFDRISYLNKVCRCPVCEKIISYDPPRLILDLEGNKGEQVAKLVTHFTYNKHFEINNVKVLDKGQYANWLIESSKELSLSKDDEEVYRGTIKSWVSAIFGISIDDDQDIDEEAL